MENVNDEINLRDMFSLVLSKWWLIIIAVCVCVLFTSFYTIVRVEPIYRADTTIYVGSDTNGKEIAYNDLILADRLVNDYRQLIKSRKVTGQVIEELGLTDSTSGLAGKITVNSVKDTRIIQIAVEDYNPEKAKAIANKVAEVFQEQVIEIMNVENVQIIDKAILPASPINASSRSNLALSALAGLILGTALILLIDFLDRTVKTPQDVRNVVNLPVLGMIPVFEERKGLVK